MTLKRFRVTVFDRLEWEWRVFEIVAKDSDAVVAYMDRRFDPQWRQTPYNKAEEDSLNVEFIENVELPIVMEI